MLSPSQAWWNMPEISAFERQRQVNYDFEASLWYIVSSKTA